MNQRKQPIEYVKVEDSVDYFNSYKRDTLWSSKSEDWKEAFKFQLLILNTYLEHGAPEKLMNQFMCRLAFGYWGIQCQGGITSGIVSAATIGLPSSQTTGDHIFGAVEIGKTVKEEFESCGRNIDYMVNVWLYENIWLWMTIKVTKEEHSPSNIIKNGHSIEQKRKMLHYKSVSELMARL